MTAKRWSYSAGQRGFSRVRAYKDEIIARHGE